MQFLVLQLEDRNDRLLQTFMDENERICNANDMGYIRRSTSSFDVPPYWGKVFEMQKLLYETIDKFDYIMWLDSDAFFVHFNRERFESFMDEQKQYSMIITADMPPFGASFNAGSFIVRNDEIGRSIVDAWTMLYNPANWKRQENSNKWTTSSPWAGDDYEQGSFATYIMNDPKFEQHIVSLPFYTINSNNCNHKETIAAHLAGHHKQNETLISQCIATFSESFGNIRYDDESMHTCVIT